MQGNKHPDILQEVTLSLSKDSRIFVRGFVLISRGTIKNRTL